MAEKIRILHLSDFHFDAKHQIDRDPVLTQLCQALKAERESGRPFHLVAVTGDIAFSGKAAEYALAKTFFAAQLSPALDLKPKHFLFVSGNHDADRSKVTFGPKAIQKQLLQQPDNEQRQQEINEVMSGQERDQLIARFKDYQTFVVELTGRKQELPWWHYLYTQSEGITIGFAGFCSAWMCHQKEEQGQLLLGRFQAQQMLKPLADVHLKIALIHHPAAYFRDSEETWGQLRREFGLILRGHLHKEDVTLVEQRGKTCLEVAAGSCYETTSHKNGFHIIEIDQAAGEIVIQPWCWEEGWIWDRNYFHEGDGYGRFPLKLSAEARPNEAGKSGFLQAYRNAFDANFQNWDLGMIGPAYSREQRPTVITLEEMYQPLRLAEGYDINNLKKGLVFDEKALLSLKDHLVMRGLPGSGKTTWMRYHFRKLLQRDDVLPLMVELRTLAPYWQELRRKGQALNLLGFLHEQLRSQVEGYQETALVNLMQAKEGPRPFLLVDGWDEVGDLGESLRACLVALQKTYPRMRVVASSRPFGVGQPSHLDGYRVLDLQPLADAEVKAFATRFFNLLHGETPQVEQALSSFMLALEQAPGARTLACTPLLLTMMLFISRTRVLPDKRHQLYELCVENLLADLPEQQRKGGVVDHPNHWCPPDREQRLRVLAKLAFQMQSEGYQKKYTRVAIVQSKGQVLGYLPGDWRETDKDKFINWLVERSGLLVDRADDSLVFAHLSFQEYLAALYLKFNTSEAKRKTTLQELAKRKSWWESLRLWAAFVDKEQPDRVDEMIDHLSETEDYFDLVSAIFADGLGSPERFANWVPSAVTQIARLPQLGTSSWAGSRQAERKNILVGCLSECAIGSSWFVLLRLQVWAKGAGLDVRRLVPEARSMTAHVIVSLDDHEVASPNQLAFGRVVACLSPIWPLSSSETMLMRSWPNQRYRLGLELQLLVLLGKDKGFLKKHGMGLLLRKEFSHSNDTHVLRMVSRLLVHDFARNFAHNFAQDLSRNFAQDLSRNFAQDLSRDLACYLAHNLAGNLDRFLFHHLTGDFARYLAGYFAGNLDRELARGLAHNLDRGLDQGWAHIMGHGWDRDMVNSYKNTRFARVKKSDPVLDDFSKLQVFGVGNFGPRSYLAHRTLSIRHPDLWAAACKKSLHPEISSDALDKACTLPDIDPLWPALARHIARCSTPTDRHLLEQRARNLEASEDGPLRWGLQFLVRGDVLFEDGSIVSLDEFCHEWGVPTLPLLEDMPPEMDVDWDEEKPN